MASRELVGRPLVPFFDADENVNDSLQPADDDEREDMDVDARVWDKELGYFVYPSEQQAGRSDAVAIEAPAKNRETRTDSGGKQLLTPSMMLSSSAPENFDSMAANGDPVRAATEDAPARSSSTKRGARKKNRADTPVRRRNGKDGSDDGSKPNSSKKGKTKANGAQNNNNGPKQKGQVSSSGKWAWSAFQSSPDPAQLPMPPFLTKPGGSLSSDKSHPAKSTATPALPAVPMAPPLPPGQPPTLPSGQPPLPPGQPPEETTPRPMSIELSMTQDLRRMLNIGGG